LSLVILYEVSLNYGCENGTVEGSMSARGKERAAIFRLQKTFGRLALIGE
jgi:hypothetical protein